MTKKGTYNNKLLIIGLLMIVLMITILIITAIPQTSNNNTNYPVNLFANGFDIFILLGIAIILILQPGRGTMFAVTITSLVWGGVHAIWGIADAFSWNASQYFVIFSGLSLLVAIGIIITNALVLIQSVNSKFDKKFLNGLLIGIGSFAVICFIASAVLMISTSAEHIVLLIVSVLVFGLLLLSSLILANAPKPEAVTDSTNEVSTDVSNEKLFELQKLLDKGIISQAEYDDRKTLILDRK
jgi:hypothetical protein